MFCGPAPDTLGGLEAVGSHGDAELAATPPTVTVPASHGLGRGDDNVRTLRHHVSRVLLAIVDVSTRV